MLTEKQKEYQKRYDKKIKMISVKYTKSDMNDYHRLKEYLKKTGKTTNSFIKELVNDFFEHEKYIINDKRIAEYFAGYCDETLLDKLEKVVGRKKFDMITDYYRDTIESELNAAYEDKGCYFGEWIEQFLADIESGDIDINVADEEFNKIIECSISNNVGEVAYYC
ncbi:hypothetical protein H8S37_07080 [Mediterraneibacter sp. NSJ-55]|uniref:Uncharacterized protein n=1 Tax=Mediterraneibacter hominis TaxID=2763054 RepID=A0A923LH58_9FIRM|nr:hypothetical protein [Mediterraneibacter hominis]MBC5688693.1 hypothetical protein [Mediterraneibacter hominis]